MHRYGHVYMTLFFRAGDPRANLMDRTISIMKDSGLVDGFFRQETPFRHMKEQEEETVEVKLVLQHFYLPLAYWAAGLFLAGMATFAMELCWHCKDPHSTCT